MTGYQVFDMKDVLQKICERKKEEIENIEFEIEFGKEKNIKEEELKEQKKVLSYISNIPDNMTVEELSVYRDYLSKFSLSPFLRDKPLLTESDDILSKADGNLFLKLVCGSFSTTYQMVYNEEKSGLELAISVETDEGVCTGKLEDLCLSQIELLLEAYLDEQLTIECFLKNDMDKDSIEEDRGIRLVIFEQKMRAIEEKYRQRKNDNEDIDAELDELLES